MKKAKYLFLLAIFILTGCATQKTSTLVLCNYDEKTDKTDYTIVPYGSVSIPGEWRQTFFNKVSKQQFFQNPDSIIISIAFGPHNRYEFNEDGSKKGFDFVTAYYEWESKYFVDEHQLKVEVIDSNTDNGFIIWRAYGKNNKSDIDSYFLFGEKNGVVNSLAIMVTDKWSLDEKISFLKEIYLNK